MDNQQTNDTSLKDGPDDVLPQVAQPVSDALQSVTGGSQVPPAGPPPSGAMQHDDSQQTIPDSRSLVAIPDQAGDNDLIEKEWVIKAKQIVEHTAEDPFTQQQELTKIKADYMKKRYNKDLGIV